MEMIAQLMNAPGVQPSVELLSGLGVLVLLVRFKRINLRIDFTDEKRR